MSPHAHNAMRATVNLGFQPTMNDKASHTHSVAARSAVPAASRAGLLRRLLSRHWIHRYGLNRMDGGGRQCARVIGGVGGDRLDRLGTLAERG